MSLLKRMCHVMYHTLIVPLFIYQFEMNTKIYRKNSQYNAKQHAYWNLIFTRISILSVSFLNNSSVGVNEAQIHWIEFYRVSTLMHTSHIYVHRHARENDTKDGNDIHRTARWAYMKCVGLHVRCERNALAAVIAVLEPQTMQTSRMPCSEGGGNEWRSLIALQTSLIKFMRR